MHKTRETFLGARQVAWGMLSCLFLIFWGCASSGPTIDYDTAAHFESLKTYYVATEGDTADSIVAERLADGIAGVLRGKGFRPVFERTQADFVVTYQAHVVEKSNPKRIQIGIGGGSFGGSGGASVGGSMGLPVGGSTISSQRIQINISNGVSDQLIWSGSDAYEIKPGAEGPGRTAAANTTIARILAEFPPGQ